MKVQGSDIGGCVDTCADMISCIFDGTQHVLCIDAEQLRERAKPLECQSNQALDGNTLWYKCPSVPHDDFQCHPCSQIDRNLIACERIKWLQTNPPFVRNDIIVEVVCLLFRITGNTNLF